jgi:hypothetical protein
MTVWQTDELHGCPAEIRHEDRQPRGDAGMVERWDMSCGRKAKPDLISLPFRIVIAVGGLFTRPGS